MNKWISVNDEMPDNNNPVMVYTVEQGIFISIWNENNDQAWNVQLEWEIGEVTHWMTLPDAPVSQDTKEIIHNVKNYCNDQIALLKITGESYEAMARLKQIQEMLKDINEEDKDS